MMFVIDPILALSGSVAVWINTGLYTFIAQTAPTQGAEWLGNISSTGLLAVVVWFLLTRIQKAIDDNTAATKEMAKAIEGLKIDTHAVGRREYDRALIEKENQQ